MYSLLTLSKFKTAIIASSCTIGGLREYGILWTFRNPGVAFRVAMLLSAMSLSDAEKIELSRVRNWFESNPGKTFPAVKSQIINEVVTR